MKAAANLPLAAALLVAVLAAATYQMLDKLTVKKYGAATTKVRSRSVGLRQGGAAGCAVLALSRELRARCTQRE